MRHLLIISFFVSILYGCENIQDKKEIKNNLTSETENSNNNIHEIIVGDCFEFKDSSLRKYGLVLCQNLKSENYHEFSFFPVLLNESKTGLSKFSSGQFFYTQRQDLANPGNPIEGVNVFVFMSDKELDIVYDRIYKIGNLKLNEKYLFITGGTVAFSNQEFRNALQNWSVVLGKDFSMKLLREIIVHE